MSISPVSSTPAVVTTRPAPEAKPEVAAAPVDKVSISPEAARLAAGGDADHDGDSH
jgi:hypothetical protein